MHWLKRDMWKAGIAIAGMLFLLILMVWVPVSAAGVYEGTSGLATPGTVQETSVANPTILAETAKEQLRKLQRDNDRSWNAWFWNNAATTISTLAVVLAALFGVFRWWFGDRRAEREKRAEENFQKVVEGLGSKDKEACAGAAIMLRTFLRPGYKQFYSQAFDLAVAYLRFRKADPETKADPDGAIPLDSLSQALITVFKESFPLARQEIEKQKPQPISTFIWGIKTQLYFLNQSSQSPPQDLDEKDLWYESHIRFLDASHIRLDSAFLRYADLKYVQMRDASLIKASFRKADLSHAYLTHANLTHANLRKAILIKARLRGADLSHAHLDEANLRDAYLESAHLHSAHLNDADLTNANLERADLSGADLSGTNLSGVNLCGVKMNNETDLKETKLQGAKYNSDVIPKKDKEGQPVIGHQGKPDMIEATRWPHLGFNPDGAVDVAKLPPT